MADAKADKKELKKAALAERLEKLKAKAVLVAKKIADTEATLKTLQ